MNNSTLDLFAALQAALGPQYRLERELGRGGMGAVFLATDATLDRRVAIKVVHPELTAHPSIARRFLAEARTIARLRHPNVVAVHTAGSTDGLLYYVMDEVAGESLRQRLTREPRLDPALVGRIVADVAAALDAASRAGIVHRDVKPENVLLEEASGRAMLADFGIARAMLGDGSGPTTGQGVAVGTPAYMSPEQAAGEEVDGRSDLYALGVVAYEMLAGHPPFQGPNRVVVSKHIAERPVPIERVRPDAPRRLAASVMKALEKHPAERWQSGEELRQALSGERPVESPARRRRRPLLTAVGVGLAALAAGIGLIHRSPGPPAGVNPRHSILVLPFDNLRDDRSVDWLRDASPSMLGLNLSQWNDLSVVDHERLHDLLSRHRLRRGADIGLDMARRLAREAGVWTVVLGDFSQAGDSLHLAARVYDVASGARVDIARVDDRTGADVRPLFDELAAKLLDLSGAPNEVRIGLARSTTASLEAYRAYLTGVEQLNRWDLAGAEREFQRASTIDTTFGLAYYKLALTRGWLVGIKDSTADRAIVRATTYSSNLPIHERTIINAYGAFLAGEFPQARGLYQQLIRRDSTDADAWYGLGEAWFHDTAGVDEAPYWTQAMRGFKHALTLDPDYALAYEHVQAMLGLAAGARPSVALVAPDSFAPARGREGQSLIDSTTLAAALRRARTEVQASARTWVTIQPTTLRAHGAMVDAYLAARNYPAAFAEVDRFKQTSPEHPESPFVEARIRFASGEVDRAAAELKTTLDSVAPQDFRRYEGVPTVVQDIAAAANVFAYQGDLASAAKAIDLADQVRREVIQHPGSPTDGPFNSSWRRMALGDLYYATGGPAASLRQVWQSAAEAGRVAPTDQRRHFAHTGASAAIGLFTGLAADTTALTEYRAMTDEPLGREVRALLALSRGDSTGARRTLAEPDTADKSEHMYMDFRRPLAAQAYYLLGDYQATLRALKDFEPDAFWTHGFDARWGMLGRVRLLRAAAYEQLGRRAEARLEYHQVLTQWRSADEALRPFVRQAEQGLARLGAAG
ncbi:MAG TPA: protein kinase [Gemmatimonadales bacterium]|jgi:serine/threonine-protein kinase|nr:protein kinase [Gemmatimonadales bacterium]